MSAKLRGGMGRFCTRPIRYTLGLFAIDAVYRNGCV